MSVEEIIKSKLLSGFRGTPEGHSGGKYVQELEEAFRERFGIKYAVAMNSATSALHASLIACGVGKGDEVIVSPFSFASSASCALMVGAKPVFVDIDPETYCIDPKLVDKAITKKTKVIIPVHLFGHPADMESILDIAEAHHPIAVIEDAAQAIMAESLLGLAGTMGDCGIFSFNQSKHINTGEGGMLVTDDDKIARIARAVRNHAESSDPSLKIVGYNYRLGEIEAYLALEQLKDLDNQLLNRRIMVSHLESGFEKEGIPYKKIPIKHACWAFAFKVKHREEVYEKCKAKGLNLNKGYNEPLYRLPIFDVTDYSKFPVTERMWNEELLVIQVAELTLDKCQIIIDSVV